MCFVRKLNISFLHIISRFVCESDYISFCRLYIFLLQLALLEKPLLLFFDTLKKN